MFDSSNDAGYLRQVVKQIINAALAFCILPNVLNAQPNVGERSLIVASYETSTVEVGVSEDLPGGRSSSRGRSALVEEVLAVQPEGIEIEFDLPESVSEEERARTWQYPVRVFKPADGGPMQLLNADELEHRIEDWLTAANIPREACGSWYFTWNAFQIECDPQAVLEDLEGFDLRLANLSAGEPLVVTGASGTLREVSSDDEGVVLTAELPLDAEHVARERAETARIAAEILGHESADPTAGPEDVSGTISVILNIDPAGELYRRVVNIEQRVTLPAGGEEVSVATYTTERRALDLEQLSAPE